MLFATFYMNAAVPTPSPANGKKKNSKEKAEPGAFEGIHSLNNSHLVTSENLNSF